MKRLSIKSNKRIKQKAKEERRKKEQIKKSAEADFFI
jgi:hypothetical protein